MMAQMTRCVSSPTLTSVAVSTSRSLSTTRTRDVTTIPGTVATSTFSTCSVIGRNTTTCGISTSLITGSATVRTNDLVLTVTVDVPVSYQATFYGSVCSTLYTDSPYITPSSRPSPSIATLTSSSIITSDGSTFVTLFTSTETVVPSESPAQGVSSPSGSTSSNPNIPVIVGGVLGGISALALIALFVGHLLKKRAPFNDTDFMKDTDTTTAQPIQKNPASDPYQYNPVAQQDTQGGGNSFSNNPVGQNFGTNLGPFNGVTGNDMVNAANPPMGNEIGMQPGATSNDVMPQYNVLNQAPVNNLQNPSLSPLIVGGGGAALAPVAAWQTRPTSVIGSDISAGPPMGFGPQQSSSYPQTLAPYAQQLGYGPPQSGHPNVHTAGSAPGSTYAASSSGNRRTSGIDFAPMPFVQQHPQQQYIQMPPMPQPQYGHRPYSQIGSSTSQVNPPLQLVNPEPETSGQDSLGVYSTPVVGSSSSAAQVDGKGRLLNLQGEKAALVRLDGTAYEPSSTPAPPAYME